MKDNIKYAVKIGISSFVLSMIAMAVLYFFFPKLFCNHVYDVHTNYGMGEEHKPGEWHGEYREIFVPSYNYIDVYLHCEQQIENYQVTVQLLNEQEKTIKKETVTISSQTGTYILAFEIEKWVQAGNTYKLVLSMGDTEPAFMPLCSYEYKTPEHVSLLMDNKETEDNLCLQYIYGTYSKKRLLLWLPAFYIASFYLYNILCKKKGEKNEEENC